MESNRGRTRNRRGEGGLLRQDIVSAAAELLDETGETGAITLRAVARRAGISAPSIYPHFPDREAIVLAVVQQEFGALHRHLLAAVEKEEKVDQAADYAAARLLALCTAYLDYARTHPQRYLVMFGGVWNAARAVADSKIAWTDVVELGQALLEDLTNLLRACVDAGRSASTDPVTDATVLWMGLHGLAHQRIVSTALTFPPDIETRLIQRLTYL